MHRNAGRVPDGLDQGKTKKRNCKQSSKTPDYCYIISVNRVVKFPGAGLGRLITINSELNGAI